MGWLQRSGKVAAGLVEGGMYLVPIAAVWAAAGSGTVYMALCFCLRGLISVTLGRLETVMFTAFCTCCLCRVEDSIG